MWEKHRYAILEIPEKDAEEIRSAIETVLLGGASITKDQKALLAKLRIRLEEMEVITHGGPAKW